MHVSALVKFIVRKLILYFKVICPECGHRSGTNTQCQYCIAFEEDRRAFTP